MSIKSSVLKVFSIIAILAMMLSNIQPPMVQAQGKDGLKRQINAGSGRVSFLGPENGRVLPASKALGTFLRPQDPAMALAKRFGTEFGLKNPQRDLSEIKNKRSDDGRLTARYQQNYQGIPVMGGELIVNTNEDGDLYSMNGEVSADLALSTQPTINSAQAREMALQAVSKWYEKTPADFVTTEPELWIYDESLLQPSTRPVELVWRMEVTPKEAGMPIRELVLVNAQIGSISLHFNQIDTAWTRANRADVVAAPTPEPLQPAKPPLPTETVDGVFTPVLMNELQQFDADVSKLEVSGGRVASLTADTWYVATTGSDLNDCATISTPCETINAAIGKAAAGNTIKVAIGTYKGYGDQVILLNKDVNLSGGWNSSFDLQDGFSIVDGEKTRRGITVGDASTPAVNTEIDRFIVKNGTDGIYATCSCDQIKVYNSAFIFNTQAGINAFGILELNNVTVSNNGAGVAHRALSAMPEQIAVINNSTIVDNLGNQSYGVYTGNKMFLSNTIISNNKRNDTSTNCTTGYAASIISDGNNLIDDLSGCYIPSAVGDKFNVDPKLELLVPEYGVRPLLADSPAIDAGNYLTCYGTTDQRGMPRLSGAACDIGAYEYVQNITAISGSNQVADAGSFFMLPLTVYVVDSSMNPMVGVTVTFSAPASGASGVFEDSGTKTTTAVTNDNGIAVSATFIANNVSGYYVVNTTVSGMDSTTIFKLANNGTLYVATTGSDSNSCQSADLPCATINGAMSKAVTGGLIKIAVGTYTGAGTEVVSISKDINLSGGWNAGFSARSGMSTIDGQKARRGITLLTGTVLIERFTIQNGYHESRGGGIRNDGTLTLNDSLLTHNTSDLTGGGIYNDGTLTVNNTSITRNQAGSLGGGGGGGGGGIQNDSGTLTLNKSSVSANTLLGAFSGSGINAFGTVILNNSTISDNRGGSGEGIYGFTATITLNNSTISGNQSYGFNNTQSSVTLKNTIISGNGTAGDCHNNIDGYSGTVTSQGYNLITNPQGCTFTPTTGDKVNVNANLGSLLGFPGYVPLLPGSPAIDAGNPAVPGSGGNACLDTDERGVARPVGARCDMGAYEYTVPGIAASLSVSDGNNQQAVPGMAFKVPLKVAALDKVGSPVSGVTVAFTAPDGGASAVFAGPGSRTATAITEANGTATASTLTANGQLGAYSIVASASGIDSVSFSLQNAAWFVANTGNDSNSCSLPQSPCASINGAINKASRGDGILIAAGTYTGTGVYSVEINKDILLYGGWDASFTTQVGASVIDGQNARGGIIISCNRSIIATLDHFMITNGKGGIQNCGTELTITNSSIQNNITTADYGGGIASESGILILNNVTVSGNNARYGGAGIYLFSGRAYLNNTTISNNIGTGIHMDYGSTATITIKNSILAGNKVWDCYSATIVSAGNNIIGNGTGCAITAMTGDQIGTSTHPINPRLAPLQDNGGSSFTHALSMGSPAIDVGNPATCLPTDQRGVSRPIGEACDIGAFEGSVPWMPSPLVETYTADNYYRLPGSFLCNQVQQPCTSDNAVPHANTAHQYAIGTSNFYETKHGRNSIDNYGIVIKSSVHYCGTNTMGEIICPYDNAFWNGEQIVYGYGYGFALADDVVAHELTHGVTQYESNLFNYYQSGAINESFSDVWGEYYDQTNGLGNDISGVKWLIGEDISGLGAIRSMIDPPTYGDPDKMSSTNYYLGSGDNGGVHYNSGINNKAVYLMVDGSSLFNGKTVTALKWEKVGAIYYEAQTSLLTSGSDYSDLYYALQQACTNLIGQKDITAADCIEVRDAVDAVEMNAQPANNFNSDAPVCMTAGVVPNIILADDIENGTSNWTFNNGAYTRWQVDSPLYGPFAQSGLHSLYAADKPVAMTDATARLTAVVVPNNAYLHFAQAYDFEQSDANYDGGLIEYSTNGGAFWMDAGSLIDHNGYTGTVQTGEGNPLEGRSAFVGASHGYISTRLNLSPLAGKTVSFRWRMGLDPYVAYGGWWVDNIKVYTCGPATTFTDVSNAYWAWSFIERLYSAGITGGCGTSPLAYCPETTVTRSQMAVFLLRGIHGSSYSPPGLGAGTGFGDVPVDYWSAVWIKQLAAEGITGGCGSGNYCPEYPVTRDQMAVFLLRSKYGSSYSPSAVGAGTGFGDVPVDHWAAPWIKQLVTEGITAGCGNGNYCPDLPVTRAQMAVFLVRTFNLP